MLLIGSDIEVFLTDGTNYKSVVGLMGGTKQNPDYLGRPGCYLQEDNVAAEFNVAATDDPKNMWEDIIFCLENIRERTGLKIDFTSAVHFNKEELRTRQAKKFGCDPDWNAYSMTTNVIDGKKDPTLRSIGGHIHLELPEEYCFEIMPLFEISKLMDLFLALPSVLIDPDRIRRNLYGKAGSGRIKPYGVEYRSLSSFWAKDAELTEWVFNTSNKVRDLFLAGETSSSVLAKVGISEEQLGVESIINKYDVDKITSTGIIETLELIPQNIEKFVIHNYKKQANEVTT